ncbi:MarR family winged helix-turn-helix transcriptional regulator [Jannaschia marina]|uniref:MarR family winged helix-turn-helix transcriptional regulator n=1 Tax=Jannaschia marina TaxID=2741674 RepID=UPI0015CC5B96|nr:MarR family winged helix-turn-helix transcriptional regulator [Jannaschia marina]
MTSSFKKPRSLLAPVTSLSRKVETAIAALYKAEGVEGVRPRFSMALIGLADEGPMTIRDLAAFTRVTHGAMSQSVKAMREAGLIDTQTGEDARSVVICLSEAGRAAVPFLEAEWDATEAMLAELDADLPYPLTRVMEDIRTRLEQEPIVDRLARHMRARRPD